MDHQHSEHPGNPWVADEEPDEGPRPAPGRWTSWLLVGVAAVPPLVLAGLGRRFLGGGADAGYVGTRADPGDGEGIDLGWSNRFGLLWMAVPVPEVLLAALAGVLVVAVLVVAARPSWLVPGRWARRVGAGAAVLTAVESLVSLVSLVRRAGASERESFGGQQISYYIPSTGEFPELLGVLALLAVTTVLPALAALVLWRAQDLEPTTVAATDGEPDADEPDAEEPAGETEVVDPEPAAGTPPEEPDVPRPSAEDLDAYRRPPRGETP